MSNTIKFQLLSIILLMINFVSLSSSAETLSLPGPGNDIVGHIQTRIVKQGENFPMIAQQYEVTYTGLVEANPGVNPNKPAPGIVLIIPSEYVLPHVPRKGIVINLAELRLYYFPPHQNVVMTYPIGIGIEGWNIKPGSFKVVEKKKDPTWYPTPAVHEELLKKGFSVPSAIPPGPDNPLGKYMLRLSNWTYLIHGVIDPATVGRRSSSGCFRMYPESIEQLFYSVKVGTPVLVINEPYKVGWNRNKLFLEPHEPLQEQLREQQANFESSPLVTAINAALGRRSAEVNWDQAFSLAKQPMGLPEQIGEAG